MPLKRKSFMTIPPFNQTNSSEFPGLRPCGIDIFKTLTDGSNVQPHLRTTVLTKNTRGK